MLALHLGLLGNYHHYFVGDISVSRAVSKLRRVVERVISAVSVKTSPEKADWRIVERMCSESVREQVNIFGRRPRNTGALCSPLL